MNLVRRHPIFCTLVAIILVGILAEAWYLVRLRGQERVLERQLGQKIAEIDRLQRARPGPTEENVRRAREDYAQHAQILTTMLRSLRVAGPDELPYFQGEPELLNSFFVISTFVGTWRQAALDAGVTIRPDERFGFSAYSNEGPEAEINRVVYRQMRTINYLLGALFAARPQTFIGVQREDPRALLRGGAKPAAPGSAQQPARPSTSPAGPGGGAAAAAAADLFAIDPQISARTPGYVDTMAFRLTFTGHTAALRGFMNALAAPEIPVVVRSVEVEPVRADAPPPGGSTVRPADTQTPRADRAIVADNESRFVVTIELFDLKIRAPEPPPGTTAAGPTS